MGTNLHREGVYRAHRASDQRYGGLSYQRNRDDEGKLGCALYAVTFALGALGIVVVAMLVRMM